MKYPPTCLFAAVLAFFLTGNVACHADGGPRDTAVSWALHVMDGQRYFDAADACAQLTAIAPEDAASFEIRGAVALQVGDIPQAAQAFREARKFAADSDALPSYGMALCALFTRDWPQAEADLAEAAKKADDTQMPDIRLAQAVLQAARGHTSAAAGLANSLQSPAAQELAAIAAYHISPKSGLARLSAFLNSTEQNGIPRVVEPAGIRLLGDFSGAAPLEPAVAEPTSREMLARRLAAGAPTTQHNALHGIVDLRPPQSLGLAQRSAATVSVSIDGQLIGMDNSAPYDFRWDSSTVANGPHTLIWSAQGASGAPASQRLTVYVDNSDAASPVSVPLPTPLSERLWNLLSIRPSYKVAQYLLAQALTESGQTEQAHDHFLIAAALNPAYKDVGRRVAAYFAGRAKARYPLPRDVKLPKISTIAGENHNIGIWIGSPNKPEMALTFDDGPSADVTPILLDALKKAGAPATFFVVGVRAAAAPQVVERMVNEGHDVEDHSYTHPNLDEALPNHVLEEVLRCAVVVRALTGRWPAFFRPPGGDANPYVQAAAGQCGMTEAFWTIDALSAEESGSPDAVCKWVKSRARSGAIVLMHNGMPATIAAIPQLVAQLRARGFRLVTLRQLAQDALP